jgi:hypothetical protein
LEKLKIGQSPAMLQNRPQLRAPYTSEPITIHPRMEVSMVTYTSRVR